jgi:hypothetical protein
MVDFTRGTSTLLKLEEKQASGIRRIAGKFHVPIMLESSPALLCAATTLVNNSGIKLIEMNLSVYYDKEYNHHHSVHLCPMTSQSHLKRLLCLTDVSSRETTSILYRYT